MTKFARTNCVTLTGIHSITELRKSLCKTYLSRTQAGPGRAVKEQHKQTSPNHVQELFLSSVHQEPLIRYSSTKGRRRLQPIQSARERHFSSSFFLPACLPTPSFLTIAVCFQRIAINLSHLLRIPLSFPSALYFG